MNHEELLARITIDPKVMVGRPVIEGAKTSMQIAEDIRPLADLENNSGEILKQLRETGRPIVLTIKGKANAVLMDAKTYEKHLRAANLSRLLAPAEADVAAGRVRSARSFLKEFKSARKISR